jgi:iron-sulfur cluster insertion protein
MIEITESAQDKIVDLLVSENNPNLKLRTYIQGGGCSGFNYGFTMDEDQNEDDFEINVKGFKVLIDAMSYPYLDGATIDYKTEMFSSQFVVSNPNAKATCGCGTSFAV